MLMKYYLYRHIRDDKNVPFYIGIGSKPSRIRGYSDEYKRAIDKNGRNAYWKRIVEKTTYAVEILFESNSLDEIIAKEIEFIALYGRERNGGTLCNLTDGGQSGSGRLYSEEYRKKCSDRMKTSFNPNKGKKLSETHRQRISRSNFGKKISELTKERLRTVRGKKIICLETGEVYNNGTDAGRRIFNSDKRYFRMAICRSIRNNDKFKNLTFKWAA